MAGVPAANRHVALIGFMGAGKSTLGAEVAARLGRRLVEVDREIERRHGTIPQVFEAHGEAAFRLIEAQQTIEALRSAPPAVISLGGGAVTSADVRSALAEHALTLLLDVDADTAWERVRGGDRPLARDELSFRALHRKRAPVYAEAADATVHDADGAVLAAGGIHLGSLELLGVVETRAGGGFRLTAGLRRSGVVRVASGAPAARAADTASATEVASAPQRALRLPGHRPKRYGARRRAIGSNGLIPGVAPSGCGLVERSVEARRASSPSARG